MSTNPKQAVFLDRDGVINRAVIRDGKPRPPADVGELEILPGVRESLDRLRDAGFQLIVVTNQPDVARGTKTRAEVEAIHAAMREHGLLINSFRVCYHDEADQCDCRKPAPGLLLGAARDYEVDLAASFMVGDRWRDIEAGRRAGCATILIDYGYAEEERCWPDERVASLSEAADWILVGEHILK